MIEPEFVMIIAIVAIACATGLISTWMKYQYRDSTIDRDNYNQLAQAFIKHKKEMQQRVSNLEEALTQHQKKDPKNYAQIEAPERGTLTNDLQEKDKVRS